MTASAGICVVSVQPGGRDVAAARVDGDDDRARRSAARTSSRKSTSVNAAVPRITRAAPARSASRTAGSERRPPPTCTGTPSSPAIRSRWCEVLRRAGPRAVEVDDVQEARARLDPRARGLERVVVVDGLGVEVALHEAHRLAVGDVDRGVEDHDAACTVAQIADEVAQQREAVGRGLLGVALRAEDVAALDERDERRRRTRRRRARSSSSAGSAHERVHVVEGRRVRQPLGRAATGAASDTAFQPMCGELQAARVERARSRPGSSPSPAEPSCSSEPLEEQLHARGTARSPARRRPRARG